MMLFSCYYLGISVFQHTHTVHGSSIVHSHFGGGTVHQHSDDQIAVIDMLSQFQSELAQTANFEALPFYLFTESRSEYHAPVYLSQVLSAYSLRGPPAEV
jgi:hypothetical protein